MLIPFLLIKQRTISVVLRAEQVTKYSFEAHLIQMHVQFKCWIK